MKHRIIYFLAVCFLLNSSCCELMAQNNRWSVDKKGGISWEIKPNEIHKDNIEMSGKFISSIINYGVLEDGSFYIKRGIVWPMLRIIPNDTYGSLIRSFEVDVVKMININGSNSINEKVNKIQLDGKLSVKSSLSSDVYLVRTLFSSTDIPAFCEKYELTNTGKKSVFIEIPKLASVTETPPEKGVEGSYKIAVATVNSGTFLLEPSKTIAFYLIITADKKENQPKNIDVEAELLKRDELVKNLWGELTVETPDPVLNKMFDFAKIRAAESIFETKGGPMHAPGGFAYYAAIWANDQAEYVNPFFPYLGYDYGISSALNSYRHFARFMNSDYKPIPSSIIAEGTDIWNGAGDRGDGAMIAYGASRFALSQGNHEIAKELWPLIEWCLEYNKRKINNEGVVASDTDELEGRFPAGKANLNTSCLYYDALISACYLGESLGKPNTQLDNYKTQASLLKRNIEKYFGANVMGFNTYKYYKENDILRAWICTPLTVGLFDRKNETINALFSPQLWTNDGLATQSGANTFWDRSTLYALRGVFAAGERNRGLKYLQYYSNRRLLGDHVPYPVEAYPEGNQRHLSAESSLYCRIYTEGVFGIRPTGLNSFTIAPQLPDEWSFMNLRKVHGFQKVFDIEVNREGAHLRLKVKCGSEIIFDKRVENGAIQTIKFKTIYNK